MIRKRRHGLKSPWLRRLLVALATWLASLALGIPLATAGNCVDDYYCLVTPRGSEGWQIREVDIDDYWRDAVRAATTSSMGERIDDYYRRAALRAATAKPAIAFPAKETRVPLAPHRFEWSDFGLGAEAALGSMLVLAILGEVAFGFRLSRHRTPDRSIT